MVWGLSPLVGFFACPILGSLSDSCKSRLGRRRPFIIIYSIGIFSGLLLLGYGHSIGNLFSTNLIDNPYVILFTIIGVVLLDFNCDACQSPARAYLIDVSEVGDHSIGLSTFTIMAGAGGSLGYLLGGIPWAEIGNSGTIKESYIEKSVIFNSNASNFTILNAFYYPNMANDHKQVLFTLVAIIYLICALISISSFKEIPLQSLPTSGGASSSSSNVKYEKMDEEEDFVGEEIFGGDATENAKYEDHEKYNRGVRMGSICMAIYSISCSIYSFFIRFLMNRFRKLLLF